MFSLVLTLRFLGPKDGQSRFSFVVPKSVAKSAVLRNTLRRRGYSAVNELQRGVNRGFTCVFFFKKGAEGLSFGRIKEEVSGLLGKAHILK